MTEEVRNEATALSDSDGCNAPALPRRTSESCRTAQASKKGASQLHQSFLLGWLTS